MGRRCAVLVVAIFALPAAAFAQQGHDHGTHSPYADISGREIQALDSASLSNYLSGAGMGFALSAELNGYPGPRHVLDMADSLRLTQVQRDTTERIFQRMQKHAIDAGREVVELERQLDQRFAHRHIDAGVLQDLTARIAALNGRLRAIHLQAHLDVTEVLSADQVAAYNRLRGYH